MAVGTIGANGTLSEEFDLESYTLIGLMADNLSLGTLDFWVAHQSLANGGVYRKIVDNNGTAKTIGPVSGNIAVSVDVMTQIMSAYRYVRIGTGSAAQANTPTLRWIIKA
jgi:hypothetical protein